MDKNALIVPRFKTNNPRTTLMITLCHFSGKYWFCSSSCLQLFLRFQESFRTFFTSQCISKFKGSWSAAFWKCTPLRITCRHVFSTFRNLGTYQKAFAHSFCSITSDYYIFSILTVSCWSSLSSKFRQVLVW